MDEKTMGARIAQHRKEKGLTQEGLATQLGVTNQAVSKWEGDVCCPDIQLLPALADALGLSLDALFGREAPAPEAAPIQEEPETAPIGLVAELPWADDDSLHAVLYKGHRLLQSENIPERSGGLLHLLAGQKDAQQVVLQFHGTVQDIHSAFAVHCEGDVAGSIRAGDGVTCGAVGGDVQAGDGVTCGSVAGSVRAGDSAQCEGVGGDVQAGDGVRCGDVGGSVQAGDSVTCGGVEGSVNAGESVRCGNVGGNVRANDSVHVQGRVDGEIQQG